MTSDTQGKQYDWTNYSDGMLRIRLAQAQKDVKHYSELLQISREELNEVQKEMGMRDIK